MSDEQGKIIYTAGKVCSDKRIVELVINPTNKEIEYLIYNPDTKKLSREKQIQDGSNLYLPPVGSNKICTLAFGECSGAVLLPTETMDYINEEKLLQEIRDFIHQYVELDESYEGIATHYVMFTWVFDVFDEIPYLRFLSPDFGHGKSRGLDTIGSICYRPIFLAGSSTPASLRRIVDSYKGTIVADEQDFDKSHDLTSDYVKILNQGFQRGRPVIVCNMGSDNREPQIFDVFCPKAVVTRKRFNDDALESRFITLKILPRTRKDIPLNLPRKKFDMEALILRNKLLKYRFDKYHTTSLDSSLAVDGIADRLNQIGIPLLSTIKNKEARGKIIDALYKMNEAIIEARSEGIEGVILEFICDQWTKRPNIYVKNVSSYLNSMSPEGDNTISYDLIGNTITSKKVGYIIRENLGLKTKRSAEGFIVLKDDKRLEELKRKYGIGRDNTSGSS